jgi:ABC-type multidrug transport system fused ATPase/permease subunit
VLLRNLSYPHSTIRKIFKLLTKQDIYRLKILLVFQLLSSLLDLLGIFLIGIIGSLTINGIQSKESSQRVISILELFRLDHLTFQSQIGVLGCITGFLFIIRTFSSLYFTRLTLNFLSSRSALISSRLINSLLKAPFERIKNLQIQEVIYGTTTGIDSLVLRVIGSLLICIADLFLLIVILVGLTIYSASLSITLVVVFGSVSYVTYIFLSKKSYDLGIENAKLGVIGGSKMSEALRSYRELYVRDRLNVYSDLLAENRKLNAKTIAGAALLPNISKYTIEASVVLGTLLIAASQFALEDANSAITGMAVYLASASRVAPSALRIQQGFLTIKNNLGAAEISLNLIDKFSNEKVSPYKDSNTEIAPHAFKGEIKADNVNFAFEDSKEKILNNLCVNLKQGKMLAVVGASGTGKSTFVDLVLGVISPSSGTITVSGENPSDSVKYWPGSIAYVPQNISIINGSILENILIGYKPNEITNAKINSAINGAQLEEFISSLPDKMDTHITENGLNLSGGQKQKIGIARALISEPGLLILDEATSSLDSKSESEIMKVINNLRKKVTIVIVAHRLSTVKDADQIIYFGSGNQVNAQSFQELIDRVPDFKEQAHLLGL